MAKPDTNTPGPAREYELKHRLTGACILIFTAVLIIPMLLEDPGIQASVNSQKNTAEGEEITFKSKIEPINLNSIESSSLSKEDEDIKPALLETETTPSDGVAKSEADLEKEAEKAARKEERKKQNELKKKEQKEQEQVVMTADPQPAPGAEVQSETKTSTEPQQPAQDIETTDESITDGWTVRVGTFSKKENVESISKLLDSSGFTTRQTEVQTTLGKATRVWLGPYEDKQTAEKVSTRLKTLTGEKGYVTRQAS